MIPTGWNPGKQPVPGALTETERQAAERLFQQYPKTQAVRKFFDGPLGSPTDGALGALPPGVRVAVSWQWSQTMPNVLPFVDHLLYTTGVVGVDLCVAHEPEKKITPAQLLDANQQLDRQLAVHPGRDSGAVRLAACMTVQRARIYEPGDLRRFVTHELADVLDILAWDWYPSYDVKGDIDHYESPNSALLLVTGFSDEMGLPWAMYEFNHERIMQANGFAVDLDPDGDKCAEWMVAMHAFAGDNGCVSWHQFHKGGGDLTYPGREREPEYQALRELIIGFEADPNDPQYKAGHEAGVVAGLNRAYDTVSEFIALQRG